MLGKPLTHAAHPSTTALQHNVVLRISGKIPWELWQLQFVDLEASF
jgi:hypothetical protein